MAKNPLHLKHCQGVRVLILQDAISNELHGKIIAHFSDNGTCTAQAFIHGGKFKDFDFAPVSCGGSGYDKLNSNLANMFMGHLGGYSAVKDLDAGLLNKFFESHDYKVTVIL